MAEFDVIEPPIVFNVMFPVAVVFDNVKSAAPCVRVEILVGSALFVR